MPFHNPGRWRVIHTLDPVQATKTAIPDVVILEPKVHDDERGWFYESWNRLTFLELVGLDPRFVQDNHARSTKWVLRGLHYQIPEAQGKLVRTTSGSVFDVAVDIRPESATFGDWVGVELSAENRRQLWMPPGMAHGYLVLSDAAEVQYKATAHYDPDGQRAIAWDDPAIGIEWPLGDQSPVVNDRDAVAPSFADALA